MVPPKWAQIFYSKLNISAQRAQNNKQKKRRGKRKKLMF